MNKKNKFNYSVIFVLLFVITSIYLIHAILLFDKIETVARYVIIGVIALFDLILLVRLFNKKKSKKKNLVAAILLVFSILFAFLGFNLNKIYSYFSDMNKDVVYSVSLVSSKENKGTNLNELKDAKIGVNKDDEHGLAQKIIDKYSLDKDNEMVEYEDYRRMLLDINEGTIDYAFVQTNYQDIYAGDDDLEKVIKDIVVIDTAQKVVEKEEVKLSGSSKDLTEPVTMLLIGIDSTAQGLQNADSFNGDSLNVVTFNPKTMTATMLSIPRDSYVYVTCMGVDNKITHSAGQGGTSCAIKTIEKLLDVTIDYYVKINFTGVVDLVNKVGGIDVDVPYSMCEQDSQRRFGKYTIYIREGRQHLDGEKALAFARNRKSNSEYCSKTWTQGERSDFVRGDNQQKVITAILDKVKHLTSVEDLEGILQVISKNIDTNMSESTMFSLYNVAKDVVLSSSSDKLFTIQKLYLDGTGQMIYDERSKLVLWDYILNEKSLNAVKKAMKDNLSGTKQSLIKTFSYEYGEDYETEVIGKGYYGTQLYSLLTNLEGKKLSEAQSWATKNGVKLNIKYVSSPGKSNNTVLSQDYPEKKRIDLIPNRTLTLTVVKNESKPVTPDPVDCTKNPTDPSCTSSSTGGGTSETTPPKEDEGSGGGNSGSSESKDNGGTSGDGGGSSTDSQKNE